MLDAASSRPPKAAHGMDKATAPTEGLPALFRRVEVYSEPAGAAEAWRELETIATISPYQTRRWLLPWIETTGRATRVSAFLAVAYDSDEKPVALLPFGTWQQGFLTVCGFLGGKDSNFNLGLFRPGLDWTSPELLRLLRASAGAGDRPIDIFVLHNQPYGWEGAANPLTQLPHQASPSFAYKVALTQDPEAYFKQNLSRESRKKLRQKTGRMKALGPVEHRVARTVADVAAILDAFIEQRMARSAALGLRAKDLPSQRAFLERASVAASQDPAVELHALFCGERILATFAGTTRGSRFCGMVMSFDSNPELLRTSPGEILLAALIQTKCEAGVTTFDLGIGEARYKDTYCPDPEPLFHTLVGISASGMLFAWAERLRLLVKRSVKQSAWAWKLVQALRRGRRKLSRSVAHGSGGRQG